ncbi:hypothetical protein GCM10027089_52470 [Nocardia thraciensis]
MTMSDQCLFCGIVAGDVPGVKVAEDDTTYAFMDIHPASDGHLLVVPKRHSRDLLDISAEDLAAVTLTAQRIAEIAVEEFGADGVNLLNCCGADAWQTVFHSIFTSCRVMSTRPRTDSCCPGNQAPRGTPRPSPNWATAFGTP